MSKCPDCGTEMKPLATSVYCPNDCDRKVAVHIEPERTEKIYFLDPTFAPKALQATLPATGQGTFLPDPIFDDEEIDTWINSVLDDGTD